MDKRIPIVIVIIAIFGIFFSTPASHKVKFETTSGDIILELDSAKAPGTVENFMKYVRSSFYNGTIFHRVIDGFMIQGGGHTEDMTEKDTDPPIKNEAYNGLKNVPYSIAMARETPPHTATSQFFINTVNNTFLNYVDSSSNWGYCVFGMVIEGMEVVKSIEAVETESVGSFDDVPKTPIIITRAAELSTDIQTPAVYAKQCASITFQTGSGIIIVMHTEIDAAFELYNLKGRTVLSYTGIKQGRNVIPLKRLSPGAYISRIKTCSKFVTYGNVFIQ